LASSPKSGLDTWTAANRTRSIGWRLLFGPGPASAQARSRSGGVADDRLVCAASEQIVAVARELAHHEDRVSRPIAAEDTVSIDELDVIVTGSAGPMQRQRVDRWARLPLNRVAARPAR
jgi:hypothetical protein